MNVYLILLFCIIVTILAFLYIIHKKIPKSQIKTLFVIILFLLLDLCLFVFLGGILSEPLSIPTIYFDYFSYIGACLIPVVVYFISLVFDNTKLEFKVRYLLLFIIPVLSLLILWTNDYHHLFYEKYSIYLNDSIKGAFMPVYLIYTYALFGISLLKLLYSSIRNAGFFSKQSILFLVGTILPIAINLLGTFSIIPMTIYVTPISFAFGILFYALAIFKFDFLKVTPIALQRIVDRISDGYLVVDEKNIIIDFNKTFLKMFNTNENYIRNQNFLELIDKHKLFETDFSNVKACIEKAITSEDTFLFEKKLESQEKYFHIEINSIRNKDTYLGTLILFKDTTQHMQDMQTIQNNQNMLMERERLASLGQLIGGIAHNLKTPIMSIAGAAEGLTDLATEYEKSVGDPEVTVEDHHEIAHDMKDWIEKIRSYTEYMSDVITAVKGQAVTMSDEQAVSFTLDELVKRVNILMRHELKNALVDLNIQMKAEPDTILKGNINSLVQVINNMISNAIQAYNGKPGNEINLILEPSGKNIIISVQDFANGLPDSVKAKLFKEMITTKGKNGTGLGLFMSYSTIRAHFNGNVTFETEKGKGTIFHISLPV